MKVIFIFYLLTQNKILGNKIKDLLKSNEGDFMFPKSEANLLMVMNNIKSGNAFDLLFLNIFIIS